MKKSQRQHGKLPPKTPEKMSPFPTDVFSSTPPFSPNRAPSAMDLDITPRRLDTSTGSTISDKAPTDTTGSRNRTVYLIRHGESRGQATRCRDARQKDTNLLDCKLTSLGQMQARLIPQLLDEKGNAYSRIQYVISSPLTRALETAVLGFPHHPIVLAYDLREVGSPIPENRPRSTKLVLADIQQHLPPDQEAFQIDAHSLRPEQWPRRAETPPKVIRRDKIRQFFVWLAENLPSDISEIAVVCHYHVIRSALSSNPYDPQQTQWVHRHLHPANAQPIPCELSPCGTLTLATGQIERFGNDSASK